MNFLNSLHWKEFDTKKKKKKHYATEYTKTNLIFHLSETKTNKFNSVTAVFWLLDKLFHKTYH